MSGGQVYTDFSQYSHAQLVQMLYASVPATVTTAAETWDTTGNALHDQANSLTTQMTNFEQEWQGGAADEYKRMVTDLIGGIRKVADTAYTMRDLTYDASDALATARTEMPQPVDVPDIAPATVTLASTPIQVPAGTSPAAVSQLQQQQAAAVVQVQQQQQAQAASNAAHAQAVQVMHTLATGYVTVDTSIPPSPAAASAPTVPAGTPISGSSTLSTPAGTLATPITGTSSATLASNPLTGSTQLTQPGTGTAPGSSGATQGSDSGLFGDMFTVGLAAASAAAFGRFGSLMPSVPGFASRRRRRARRRRRRVRARPRRAVPCPGSARRVSRGSAPPASRPAAACQGSDPAASAVAAWVASAAVASAVARRPVRRG